MTEQSSDRQCTAPAPPRVLAWVALAVCLAGVVSVLTGAWQVGVWGDEPAHVVRYDNLQEHGWYLLDDDFDDAAEPGPWVTDRYVYAPVVTQLMHGVNRVLGLDPPGGLGTTIRAYGVRHMVVGLLGLLGALAVVAIGRRLFGSWSWGLVAGATLLAIPMWPGLSMFDIKDVPAATGYTLVTLGLLELLVARESGTRSPSSTWWGVVALAAGLVLAIGVRPGLWPGLAVSIAGALAMGAGRSAAARPTGPTWRRGVVMPVVVAGVLAYAVLLLSYPEYFLRPHEWLPGAIGDSSQYTGSPTAGMQASRTYLPARVVATMPPLLLVVGAAGAVTAAARWAALARPVRVGWLLVASQALLLPTLAVVMGSALYDDLRQVLFAAPAVALLLTWGWQRVAADVGATKPALWQATAVLWSVALLVPTAVQLQMYPYGYSYVSPVAEELVVEKDWARLSLRAMLPDLPDGQLVVCNPQLSDDDDTMRYNPPTGRPASELSTDCRTDPVSILSAYRLVDRDDPGLWLVQDTFVGVFARGKEPGRNCEELGQVSRMRYLNRVVLGRVAECDLVLNDYPSEGVDLAPDGTGSTFLLGGWTSTDGSPGVRMREPSGRLGFRLPGTMASRELVIGFEGESESPPAVLVNNEPVDVRAAGDGWEVEVEPSTVDAFGGRRLVMSLVRRGDEQLVLTRVEVATTGDPS